MEHDSRVHALIDAAQRLSSFEFVPTEYVCVDRTRVRATDTRAIAHDLRVRAVLQAAAQLSLFVPTHIAQANAHIFIRGSGLQFKWQIYSSLNHASL